MTENNNNLPIVQTSLMPFDMGFNTKVVEPNQTLQQIYESTAPLTFSDCQVVMTLNGLVVPEDKWSSTLLTEKDFACINVVPTGGGGGGGKSTAVMVLGVVAAIALPMAAAAVGSASMGGGLSASAWATAAANGAITTAGYIGYGATMIAGSMLLGLATSAIMGTPTQGESDYEKQIDGFIQGTSNKVDRFGVIPVNLGTNRMFPNQAANPYTEVVGNDNYVRQMFTFGYGSVDISQERFGETRITEYQDVETDYRLNADLIQGTKLYTTDATQYAYNILLQQYVETIRTTDREADEAVIDVQFQKGLYNIYSSKAYEQAWTVEFDIASRKIDSESDNYQNIVINADMEQNEEFIFETIDNITKAEVTLDFPSGLYQADVYSREGSPSTIEDAHEGDVYYKSLSVNTSFQYRKVGETTWSEPVNWSVSSKLTDYVNGDTARPRYSRNPFTDSKMFYFPESGQYEIKLIRTNAVLPATEPPYKPNPSAPNPSTVYTYRGHISTLQKVTASDAIAVQPWSTPARWSVTDYKQEPFTVSHRIVFDERGQHDVKITRVSKDYPDKQGNDRWGDDSTWVALKSFTYRNPINQKDISGLAIRIRASDQLSGTVENYNAVVSTILKGYNPDTALWEDGRISSNPADLYRYVLQSPAFVKRVSDEQIDLKKLEEWWYYCDKHNLSFNKIIDSEVSVQQVLSDICAAGVATPTKLYNIHSVIIDNEREYVKGLVTPRNSWDYTGNITYNELPHALRVEFRNKDIGYESDERIVYRDGYTEENAELFERLQFDSCTNADLAYWYGRRYFATAELQPETHNFQMDFENLTFNRGDRIQLINDVVLVGVGQGRIRELFKDNDGNFTGFRIDDTLSIPVVPVLGCRIRHNNGDINYYQLSNVSGDNSVFNFSTPLTSDVLEVDNLVAFVEDGKELDLIISEIKPGEDLTATITAIDYAPARFNPLGEIPPFDSNITIPLDLYQPLPPVQVGEITSDESVMIKNSDGSYTSLMSIHLENRNKFDVACVVRYKLIEATEWTQASYIKNTPENIKITGLLDGKLYDIEVRYQSKINNMMLSNPLVLNGVKFVGNSTPPADVENFNVIITNGLGLFEWTANSDLDISHYEIRYTNDLNEILWQNLQPIFTDIKTTTITSPIRQGLYMIKAVDVGGNESRNATVITSLDDGSFNNTILTLPQEPEWTGIKEGCSVINNAIVMNSDVTEAIYTFAEDVDLGDVYECSMAYVLNSGVSDEDVTIRTISDIRSLSNVRNILQTDWSSNLEMNLSKDNITWTGWQQFKASQQTFRYAKFRIVMNTEDDRTIVFCSKASVEIDMPDRYESGEDVLITDAQAGLDVVYKATFFALPSVNVTIQDGQQGDRVEIINKQTSGFTIKVFNDISNQYVVRSFDYLSAGYGKIIKTIGG